jgi:hypothetical protein
VVAFLYKKESRQFFPEKKTLPNIGNDRFTDSDQISLTNARVCDGDGAANLK